MDINMKSILKPLLISSAFSVIGLSCTISSAFADSLTPSVSHAATTANYIHALPTLSSEGINRTLDKSYSQNIIVNNIINTPSLSLAAINFPNFTPQKSNNKNKLFQMATIFNDKLKHFLSFFSFNSSYQEIPKNIDTDEIKDTTSINVTSKCDLKT